jgi:DNA polymerase-3 subunit beta
MSSDLAKKQDRMAGKKSVSRAKADPVVDAENLSAMFSRTDIETAFCVHKKDVQPIVHKLNSLLRVNRKMPYTEKVINLITSVDHQSLSISIADGSIAKCRASVNVDINCFVPSDIFSAALKEIQNDWLYMSILDKYLRIECRSTMYNLVLGEAPVGWKNSSKHRYQNEISVESMLFKSALQDTIFAIDIKENFSICLGVHFIICNDFLTLVATDTRRIAENRIPLQKSTNFTIEMTLPKNDLDFMVKQITTDDILTIRYNSADSSSIEIGYRDSVKKINAIEGRYPTYQVAFSKIPQNTVVVETNELCMQLKQVMKLALDYDQLVQFTFSAETLKLKNIVTINGVSENSLPVNNLTEFSGEIELAFISKLFLSVISHINTRYVSIGIVDKVSPVWIEPYINTSLILPRYIVMPKIRW